MPSTAFAGASLSNRNCAPCTDFTSEINKSEIDHAKNIDVSFNGESKLKRLIESMFK